MKCKYKVGCPFCGIENLVNENFEKVIGCVHLTSIIKDSQGEIRFGFTNDDEEEFLIETLKERRRDKVDEKIFEKSN